MKKLLLLALISILFYNCNNRYEKSIIGTWYSLDEKTKLTYTTDSIFVNDITRKGTWKADKNQITCNWIHHFQEDSIIKNEYLYQLIHRNRIVLFYEKDSSKQEVFLRSANFIDYLFKKNDININLEKNHNAKYSKTENKYGIKIFIGYKNDSLIIKSEYSKNLDNLDYDIESILKENSPFLKNEYDDFHDSFKKRVSFNKWVKMNLYYSIFVDKKIPQHIVDSTVKKLKNSSIQRIYRAYKAKESRYIDFYKIKEVKL